MYDEVQDMIMRTKSSPIFRPTGTHSATATHSASATSQPTWIPALPTIEKAGDAGARTLWVIFVGMFLSSLIFGFMAYRTPVQKRLFHIITTFITVFATLSYFAMAVGYKTPGHGNSFAEIKVHDGHSHHHHEVVMRQVFWARYVDWTVTTPLLLLDLAFLAGMNGANILVAIVADVIMIITGLFAAYGHSAGEKWAWYAMACAAYLVVIWQLAVPGRRAVTSKDAGTSKLFASIAGYTLVLWTLYPIVWGIGDGARLWSVDAEILAYAILDVLAKPVFGFWLLLAHSSDFALEGFWSHGLGGEGSIRIEEEEGA